MLKDKTWNKRKNMMLQETSRTIKARRNTFTSKEGRKDEIKQKEVDVKMNEASQQGKT